MWCWAGAVVDASGVFLCARWRNFFEFDETKPRRMVGAVERHSNRQCQPDPGMLGRPIRKCFSGGYKEAGVRR
jgi:hypothetical protein